MTTGFEELPLTAQPPPLFILSFRHREELAAAAEIAGWRAIAARRSEGAEQRFLASGAAIAVIDARGALEDGLAALALLADTVEANGGALLTLLSRNDVAALDSVFDGGATHYLASPFGDSEFAQALRFAARHSGRLLGSAARERVLPAQAPDDGPGWHGDPLTGLREASDTRRWVDGRLREGQGVTLMLIAISRFEMINAAFDRNTGDTLLRLAARRIERLVGDVAGRRAAVARIAGAEFAVALDDAVPADRALLLAEEIAQSLARPFVIEDHVVPLSCRIGMAGAEAGEGDASGLLRRASAALADAKASESAAPRRMSVSDADAAAFGSRLEIDLRRAIDQNEIELVFQPQVSIVNGTIVGVEALARWRHPDFGPLGASTLFAAAERSEYLVPLSEHLQHRAVAIAASWPEPLNRLRLSLNVTAADIAEPGFVTRFLAMVDESGFPRARLTVEVTESGLIEDLSDAGALLAALRAAGCRVAIDDFGTGYSSLAYLKALPLDYLKIDKALAEDIAGSSRDRVVVRGVIEMARSLGLSVVAEGVETEAQLALLAAEGCNYYQGFLCSEPIDSAHLIALVRREG